MMFALVGVNVSATLFYTTVLDLGYQHEATMWQNFDAQLDADISPWRNRRLNLSLALQLSKSVPNSFVLRFTSTSVQVISDHNVEASFRAWWDKWINGCPARTELVSVSLEHFRDGVASMPFDKVAYMVINTNDLSLTPPQDETVCKLFFHDSVYSSIPVRTGIQAWAAFPVMSYAKIPSCSQDILLPWPDLFVPTNRLRCSSLLFNPPLPPPLNVLSPRSSINAFRGYRMPDWDEHRNTVVWRGGTSGFVRAFVLAWAAKRNDIDVKVCSGGSNCMMTIPEQAKSRVILDMDGVSYSKRLSWLWGISGSAVLRTGVHDDVLLRQAVAGKDYVRFDSTEASFNSAVDSLLSNGTFAHDIAQQGKRFGQSFLKPDLWKAYVVRAVTKYCEQLVFMDEPGK